MVQVMNEKNRADEFLAQADVLTWASATELLKAHADDDFDAGLLLGRIERGAQTVTAAAGGGNVTNDALTLADPKATADAAPGIYEVRGVSEKADSGEFIVVRPDKTIDGFGKVGTPYDGTVKFTIADGSTDLKINDYFIVTVSYAAVTKKLVPIDLEAADGSQNFYAILRQPEAKNAADKRVYVIKRGPYVRAKRELLVFPAAATNNQKAAIEAQMAAVGIDVIATV